MKRKKFYSAHDERDKLLPPLNKDQYTLNISFLPQSKMLDEKAFLNKLMQTSRILKYLPSINSQILKQKLENQFISSTQKKDEYFIDSLYGKQMNIKEKKNYSLENSKKKTKINRNNLDKVSREYSLIETKAYLKKPKLKGLPKINLFPQDSNNKNSSFLKEKKKNNAEKIKKINAIAVTPERFFFREPLQERDIDLEDYLINKCSHKAI